MKKRIERKRFSRARIRRRIRRKVSGTKDIPRLSVYKSLKHMYAQVFDDEAGIVIASASSMEKDGRSILKKSEKATFVGKVIAERLLEKGCSSVVFDRGGFPFHGLVKTLADTARETGLKF